MNTFKTIGIVLVVCFSLLLNGVACVLIAMSMKQQGPIDDADVVVAGVGNSGNDITTAGSPRRLARRVMERNLSPAITDAMLQESTTALIERARQGDAHAAAFLFELAAAQREKAKAAATWPVR
jgi:hypothetical protein